MKCCPNCFGDRGLKREIIPQHSDETGQCPRCGLENQPLTNPDQLAAYFDPLISIYSPNDNGKTLVELLKEDWLLFADMDDAHVQVLLAEILNDGEIVRKLFIPSDSCYTDGLDRWEKLRSELKHENRFFPKTKIDFDRLEDRLSRLILDTDETPAIWYRARIQEDDTGFTIEKMSAPPKKKASHGRANPAGISYLYVGSTTKTAISEIRPHSGQVVWVAEFTLREDLKIADLREPRKTISPFLSTDENEIALLRRDIELLEKLGKELATPVPPTAAAIDYIPSQYLCEFIKKSGFSGVVYKSSVSEGINLVLFNPSDATANAIDNYTITKVSVEVAETT